MCELSMNPNDGENDDEKTLNRRDDTQPINNRNNNDLPVDDDNVEFPDDDESSEANDLFTNAIPWREVPQNVWLRVYYIIDVTTQYGPGNIVGLRKRDGEVIKAWTTSIIGAAVKRKDKNKESKNLFIKSLGKTQSKKRKTYYYNFQVKLL